MDLITQKTLLEIIKKEVAPATGCTEPVAVAYSVAKARENLGGSLLKIQVRVTPGLYKNGMNVGIPGTTERGLPIAAALGFVIGKTDKGFRLLDDTSEEILEEAKDIVRDKKVDIQVAHDFDRLYLETTITTLEGTVRVLTVDRHQNIVSVERDDKIRPYSPARDSVQQSSKQIKSYRLDDFISFAEKVPIYELLFLKQGIEMNMRIAEVGLEIEGGTAFVFKKMISDGVLPDNLVFYTQMLCAAASEARMSGVKMPVMSCVGSGNHGITVFLINTAVAIKKGIAEDRLLRALALTILITVYIKAHTGILSAMCGCGVAAGIAGSAGVVYLLGGDREKIFGVLLNMVGAISGIICDGGKEGCSHKLMLASGWAVQAALLSMNGAVIDPSDGILARNFDTLFENLGQVCNKGMQATDRVILQIMQKNP